MLKAIFFSLFAFVAVAVGARGCGLTPAQVEAKVLLAELNVEEGDAFRSANRRRDGVIELSGGLQVEMLTLGNGPTPVVDDWVIVHFRGTHIDGRVFDDSRRHGVPAVVPLERTIAGWQRVLVGLPVGSHVRLVIPPGLAYGRAGGGPIGPEETLVFELELIGLTEPPKPQVRDAWQQPVPGLKR